jgi:dCTP deaminase
MILCDSEIQAALGAGQLIIEPRPAQERYTTTAVDLLLGGDEFKRWKTPGAGVGIAIDPSAGSGWFGNVSEFLEDVPLHDGAINIKPGEFILAKTKERVELPESSRIAARVEGKSSLGRIGLAVHVTAPTIHSGFKGHIVLEIKNHGVFPIRLAPGMPICQLIFEMVFGTPSTTMSGIFQNQIAVTGSTAP